MGDVMNAKTVQAVGAEQWDKTQADLFMDFWELEHFSTCYAGHLGVIYSGIFVKRAT